MGELKAALPLGRGTVLAQSLASFRQCGIDELIVVTGHRAAETSAIAERCGARPVYNPDFASGMYSSIRTGVGSLAAASNGFFLLPVDIPLVRPGTIRLLLGSSATMSPLICYPTFAGRRGHPPLLAGELIAAIIDGEEPTGGLRSLLAAVEKQRPQRVVEVAVADANILFDMDSPEDYQAGRRLFARLGYPTIAEAEVILGLHPVQERGLAHGRLVGRIAKRLCQAIGQNTGRNLDPQLCEVCGLLHDMAKGRPEHEREGARWLAELGFDRAAEIVAAHKDLAWSPGMPITEKELVHLADKLARGSRIVAIAERFGEKLALYRDKPEVVAAIQRRYRLARELGAGVEAEVGRQLADILADI
jgi:molybdenum cofactor cytidylyltransferase